MLAGALTAAVLVILCFQGTVRADHEYPPVLSSCVTFDADHNAEDDFAPGEDFIVEGRVGDFPDNEDLTLEFDGDVIDSGESDDDGDYSIRSEIPDDADEGSHDIRVSQDEAAVEGGDEATCNVDISDAEETPEPTDTPDPDETATPAPATARPTERPRGGLLPKTGSDIGGFAGLGGLLLAAGLGIVLIAYSVRRGQLFVAGGGERTGETWTEADSLPSDLE